MGFTEETVRFRLDDTDKQEINKTLISVYRSLKEKGYNPINQIIGYVLIIDNVCFSQIINLFSR